MRRREDPACVNDAAATKLRSAIRKRNLPGKLFDIGVLTSDDFRAVVGIKGCGRQFAKILGWDFCPDWERKSSQAKSRSYCQVHKIH